jgi:hypothetical protein
MFPAESDRAPSHANELDGSPLEQNVRKAVCNGVSFKVVKEDPFDYRRNVSHLNPELLDFSFNKSSQTPVGLGPEDQAPVKLRASS